MHKALCAGGWHACVGCSVPWRDRGALCPSLTFAVASYPQIDEPGASVSRQESTAVIAAASLLHPLEHLCSAALIKALFARLSPWRCVRRRRRERCPVRVRPGSGVSLTQPRQSSEFSHHLCKKNPRNPPSKAEIPAQNSVPDGSGRQRPLPWDAPAGRNHGDHSRPGNGAQWAEFRRKFRAGRRGREANGEESRRDWKPGRPTPECPCPASPLTRQRATAQRGSIPPKRLKHWI